ASQQRIRYTASGIRYHPLYVSSTLRYDIAVVLLNSSITFTDRIQPVRLPARSDTRQFGGFVGTLSGFGRTTDASQSISTVVRFTSNPVMTNANCITRWGSSNIQDQNVCLSGTGGRSSCNGDSGGPLTVESGGPIQIGVVSFVSIRGCEAGMPSVYSRVSFYLNWVEINSDFQRIRFTSTGIRRHPEYDDTSLRNDVALILLNSPMTFTSRVKPISLPARTDTRQFEGFTGTVSGFGRSSDASPYPSSILRFTSNPIMSKAECIVSWGFALAQSQNVCLKPTGGRSSCNGDSGGPLTVNSGGVLQIGTVSFGSSYGCASGWPSMYARVSYFLSWINENIW
ncbi:AGAP012736-PA, partial [Anopheles gambiae str. PEST]